MNQQALASGNNSWVKAEFTFKEMHFWLAEYLWGFIDDWESAVIVTLFHIPFFDFKSNCKKKNGLKTLQS